MFNCIVQKLANFDKKEVKFPEFFRQTGALGAVFSRFTMGFSLSRAGTEQAIDEAGFSNPESSDWRVRRC